MLEFVKWPPTPSECFAARTSLTKPVKTSVTNVDRKFFIMRKRKKLIWILLGCVIVIVLTVILFGERQPQYQGRSLSQWIVMLDGSDPEISQRQAELAIRSIG